MNARLWFAASALLLGLSVSAFAEETAEPDAAKPDAEGFVSLFDGKTLTGWDGDPAVWGVVDGYVVGKHGGWKRPNTFLCTKEKYGDFVLKISFHLVKGVGNSGVQFRSTRLEKFKDDGKEHAWMVKGYQADIDGGNYLGCCYEERGRGVLAHPNAKSKTKFPPVEGAADKLKAALKKDDWNEFTITVQGDKVTQEINGVKVVEFTDPDGAKEGIIALQAHAGGPMEIRFKDIKIKKLGQ
jgi:hypothetical protein